jgi:hypothetical protein
VCSLSAECEGDGRILGWTAPAVEFEVVGFHDGISAPAAYKLG